MKIIVFIFVFVFVFSVMPMELGPVNTENGVLFRFYYPGAKMVSIAGDFNGWDKNKNFLKEDSKNSGYFTILLKLKEGEYAYKFVVNGEKWVVDKNASKFVDDGFGGRNSVVVVKIPKKTREEIEKIIKRGKIWEKNWEM